MSRYLVAALSTIFATVAGLLTNVFTNGWSVPVGVGLVFLVGLWFVFEWYANRPPPPKEPAGPVAVDVPRPATPAIWNVPPHNHEFTGRDAILADLHQRLNAKDKPQRVQVLRGIAGVGKTQLATEFAWRNEKDYDTVWWINSDDETLIGEQLAALGIEMKVVDAGAPVLTAANTVRDKLRVSKRWLLIFDNAEMPEAIRKVLPGGAGHVLITSRTTGWDTIGHTSNINPMERAESITLLQAHDPDLERAEAQELAESLGDLPLALVQVGNYLADSGISVPDYLDALNTSASNLLQQGLTGDYPRSLAAALMLSIERQRNTNPLGLAIVRLGAFVAPEPFPTQWLTKVDTGRLQRADVIDPLLESGGKPLVIADAVSSANRLGLIKVTHQGFYLHRLQQLILRDELEEYPDQGAFRAYARAALVSHRPAGNGEKPETWPHWARMVPHLLAVDPSLGTEDAWCRFACDASWYMIERGDSITAAKLASELRDKWIRSLGRDHPMTLLSTRCLARAMRENGDWSEAKAIYADALERYTRVLGPKHQDTLRLQHGGAINLHLLGEYAAALSQQTDAWEKYKEVKGDKFLHTLHAANHAANALRELNRAAEACDWHRGTLAFYEETVGHDNPDTLRCASNLALDLRALGRFEEARVIQEDTLGRRRRVLGDNNRYTLQSASELGATLFALGQTQKAHDQLTKTHSSCKTFLGADHVETLRCATNLLQTLHALGRSAEAQPLADDTYRRYGRSSLKPTHPDYLRAWETLALILDEVGQGDDADRHRRQMQEVKRGDETDPGEG